MPQSESSKLIAQAEAMARPCLVLKRDGDSVAALWGGEGVVTAPDPNHRHWLSIDCRFLPEGLGPDVGVLSVYTDEEDGESGFAVYDPQAVLPHALQRIDGQQGEPLFAHPARSLPPPDAFEDGHDDDAYVRHWQDQCPMYADDIVAVLGGWHFPWPDGDWESNRERPLLVWTLEESEPWVEVWGGGAAFQVTQRVT
ncbi:hypothetical protein [Lysobacter sp. CA199]|uniref:hypothetical protein n=1 Tax=Lysobacter sp. CA199 TaxID=3455608 RepID=UPI003F8D893B